MKAYLSIMTLACVHLDKEPIGSSARVCISDAVRAEARKDILLAMRFAVRSLSYSIGILHPDYARAWQLAGYPSPICSCPPYLNGIYCHPMFRNG